MGELIKKLFCRHKHKKMLLESQGYIPERDYPYELDQVIEELGFSEK